MAGGLNVFQYAAYIIATALYAAGFAEYVAALAGNQGGSMRKVVGVGVVVVFTGVNLLSSKLVGRSETVIIAIEMLVLVGFVSFSVPHLELDRLSQPAPDGALGVLSAAALLYVTYQGFGVAATAGGSMGNPKRDLPRALYVALGIVGRRVPGRQHRRRDAAWTSARTRTPSVTSWPTPARRRRQDRVRRHLRGRPVGHRLRRECHALRLGQHRLRRGCAPGDRPAADQAEQGESATSPCSWLRRASSPWSCSSR